MELVLRRKIKRQVMSVRYLFGVDLIPLLEYWAQEPAETLNVAGIVNSKQLLPGLPTGEMWVRISTRLEPIFDIHETPKQLGDNVACYQFNIDKASDWLKSLVHILRHLKEIVQSYRGGVALYGTLNSLYSYLYELHEFLDAIHLLQSLRQTRKSRRFQGRGDDVIGQAGTSSNVILICLKPTPPSLKQNLS